MANTKLSIIAPIRDNDGSDLSEEIDRIRQEILTLVGGFTESPCSGAWRSNGRTYFDSSVSISVVTSAEIADIIVEKLAPVWARKLKQECLYVERSSVDVAFVPPIRRESHDSI